MLFFITVLFTFLGHAAVHQPYPSAAYVQDELELYSDYSTAEALIKAIFNEHQESLYFVVMDLELPLELRSEEVLWRDPRVTSLDLMFYEELTAPRIQSVAFHIAPHLNLKNFPDGRPLMDKSLIALKSTSPVHVILHEYLHFFIYQFQIDMELSIRSSDLLRVVEGVGEEVFVDTFLVQNSEHLGFNQNDTCMRHNYLNQNLMLLSSFLSELDRESLSSSDLEVFNYMRQVLTEGQRSTSINHSVCFLLRLQ